MLQLSSASILGFARKAACLKTWLEILQQAEDDLDMVESGTEVSPLIAVLQYRDALLQQGQLLGAATLYFGCRDRSDFLYQEQMQTWQIKDNYYKAEGAGSEKTCSSLIV